LPRRRESISKRAADGQSSSPCPSALPTDIVPSAGPDAGLLPVTDVCREEHDSADARNIRHLAPRPEERASRSSALVNRDARWCCLPCPRARCRAGRVHRAPDPPRPNRGARAPHCARRSAPRYRQPCWCRSRLP